MRRMLYIVLILLTVIAPVHRVKISELKPVESLHVEKVAGEVMVVADTGDRGTGATVEEALKEMEKNTAGVLYLETVRRITTGKDGEKEGEELAELLGRDIKISKMEGEETEKWYKNPP